MLIPTAGGTGTGAFTSFGGYTNVWPGYIRQSLDVYIDPDAGSVGDGWFLDNAVSSPGGSWREAGGVGAVKKDAGDGVCSGPSGWAIAADGDGGGYTTVFDIGVCITEAGWYTIVSEWVESAGYTGATTDTIDRNTFIYDSGGNLIYNSFHLGQQLLANVGGWRYGWIAKNSASRNIRLAIDNSVLRTDFLP